MKLNIKTVVLTLIAVITSASVMAGGGLAAASTAATTFQTWLYSFLGICSGIYMLYVGAMAKAGKKSWGEFAMGIVHVAVVGGGLAAATFAWSIFA
ncbi:MAG: conjugal transfer protein [Pseudomonadota bacterium]